MMHIFGANNYEHIFGQRFLHYIFRCSLVVAQCYRINGRKSKTRRDNVCLHFEMHQQLFIYKIQIIYSNKRMGQVFAQLCLLIRCLLYLNICSSYANIFIMIVQGSSCLLSSVRIMFSFISFMLPVIIRCFSLSLARSRFFLFSPLLMSLLL